MPEHMMDEGWSDFPELPFEGEQLDEEGLKRELDLGLASGVAEGTLDEIFDRLHVELGLARRRKES